MLRRLNRIWRTVREIDLDAIRRAAEAPVPLLVVAGDAIDREAVARLLIGDADPSPWLQSAPPDQLAPALAAKPAKLAVLVSRGGELPGSIESARALLATRRIPVVSVKVGSPGVLASLARRGEKKRVVLESLGERQRDAFAAALFEQVQGDARLALARQFPGLRQPLFDRLITETARTNAGYSLTTGLAEVVPLLGIPLTIGDVVILTKNQLIMAYRIALASGKRGRPRELVGELMGVLGGGLLARQVARELIGLIPVAGIIPKVAVAYTGTWGIGHAVAAWANGGGGASIDKLYDIGRRRGWAMARQLARRRASAVA